MAYEIPGLKIGTLHAPTTAWGDKQYYAVTASSSEGYIATPTVRKSMLGILQNAPSISGESCEIMSAGCGVSKARNSAALDEGVAYSIAATGLITTASTVAGSVNYGPVLIGAASSGTCTVSLAPVGLAV